MRFLPAPEVIAFNRAAERDPDNAAQKLAPSVLGSCRCLLPRLRLSTTMEEREAVEILAVESAASLQHQTELEKLLDYGAASGLIQRENGIVRIMRGRCAG